MIFQYSSIVFENFIIIYFFFINLMYTFIFLISFLEIRKQRRQALIDDYRNFAKSKIAPGVSLIAAIHNEHMSVKDSTISYLNRNYPKVEVIVVNDGSTDNTLEILIKKFLLKKVLKVLRKDSKTKEVKGYYLSERYPNLIVLDKINGGKADALNAGLNAAHYPYFASLDGDAILQQDALLMIMKPIFEDPRRVIGSGGMIRVVNGCIIEGGGVKEIRLSRNPLVVFQILEYIRAFTAGKTAFSLLNSLMISSGAFSVYNTDLAREIGGYDVTAIGEDFEFLTRVHKTMKEKKREYEISFRTYPICWTEVPSTFKALGMQRNRWHRGLTGVLHKHEQMIFNPKYGRIGLFSLPFYFVFEFTGTIIESMGYIFILTSFVLGMLNPSFFLSFFALSILWGIFLSMLAVLCEEINFRWYSKWTHVLALMLFALLENFSYRQLNLFWRMRGLFDYVRGDKTWGVLERKGFKPKDV